MSLKEIYYKYNFPSEDKLYRLAKEQTLKLSRKDIHEFLKKQEVAQIMHKQKKGKIFNSYVADYPKQQYQMDLVIFDRYEYHKYKYILTCIDIDSRYAMGRALTTKKFDVIMKAIKNMWDENGKPELVQVDNEFNTEQFRKYCEDNNIKVLFSQPNDVRHNAIIERFHYTLSNTIQKWRIATKSYDWPSFLPKIFDTYNNIYHKTIKAKPFDVFTGKDSNKQEIVRVQYKFKEGDKVRIKMLKKVFQKGDAIAFSKELFTIDKQVGQRYKLKEVDELLRPQDLRKIEEVEKYEIVPQNEKEEVEHKETQKSRRVRRMMKKTGIKAEEFEAPKRPKREWKPIIKEGYVDYY